MICDGDSKAYNDVWDVYGVCDQCLRYENMDKKSKEYKEWIDSAGKEEHQFGIAVCKQGTEIGLHWTCTETNGKALRERKKKGGKLSNGKGIGGQGHRPTDGCIDKLQLYYGQAIRAHTTEGTTTDTKALTEGIEKMKILSRQCCTTML